MQDNIIYNLTLSLVEQQRLLKKFKNKEVQRNLKKTEKIWGRKK